LFYSRNLQISDSTFQHNPQFITSPIQLIRQFSIIHNSSLRDPAFIAIHHNPHFNIIHLSSYYNSADFTIQHYPPVISFDNSTSSLHHNPQFSIIHLSSYYNSTIQQIQHFSRFDISADSTFQLIQHFSRFNNQCSVERLEAR